MVLVRVFDDWKSLIHFILGFITYFCVYVVVPYAVYQLVEVLYRKEPARNTIGDFLEYFTGIALARLVLWWL